MSDDRITEQRLRDMGANECFSSGRSILFFGHLGNLGIACWSDLSMWWISTTHDEVDIPPIEHQAILELVLATLGIIPPATADTKGKCPDDP